MENQLDVSIRLREETREALSSAQSNLETFQNVAKRAFDGLTDSIKEGGLAASAFLASTGLLARSMIDLGATMEQNKIAFTTFLGSATLAGAKLKELSDFAVKTPFDLPQVMDGARRLLAMGIEADKLLPTFKMLGDMAAGVGTDKLPQLILAFGQVKAATKLTGMELRQFTEAGIPLLDELAKYYTSTGKAVVSVGTASKKTKVDVGELNDKLGIAKQRLAEATANAKTKKSTLMSLQNTVQNYEQKLSKANDTGTTFSGVLKGATVTAAQVRDMISDGAVSFEDVSNALERTTQKGGRFFDLMDKQSHSLSGTLSNVRDNWVRFTTEVLGFDQNQEIRNGSIFYYLKEAANKLLEILNTVKPIAVKFFDDLLKNKDAIAMISGAFAGLAVAAGLAFAIMFGKGIIVASIFAAIGSAISYVASNWDTLWVYVELFAAVVVPLLASVLLPLIGVQFVTAVQSAIAGIGLLVGAFNPLILAIGFLTAGFFLLGGNVDMLKNAFMAIITTIFNMLFPVGNVTLAMWGLKTAQDSVKAATDSLKQAQDNLSGASLNLEQAELQLERATKTAKETTAKYGATSLEAREAEVQRKQAVENLKDAQDRKKESEEKAETAVKNLKKAEEEAKEASDKLKESTDKNKNAWVELANAIGNVINKFLEWVGLKQKNGGPGAGGGGGMSFADGGWVPQTGMALVHAGEYVLSKDMLSGRSQPEVGIGRSQIVNNTIYAEINTPVDLDYLTYKLGYMLRNS